YAALPRLGALRQLELDHLYLGVGRIACKAFLVEEAIVVATAEITRADVPDQRAAGAAMVSADATLARVVGKIAFLRPAVERQHGIGRQGAEAHRRNIEHRHLVGLGAFAAPYPYPEVRVVDLDGGHRVVDPLVLLAVHVLLGAERPF